MSIKTCQSWWYSVRGEIELSLFQHRVAWMLSAEALSTSVGVWSSALNHTVWKGSSWSWSCCDSGMVLCRRTIHNKSAPLPSHKGPLPFMAPGWGYAAESTMWGAGPLRPLWILSQGIMGMPSLGLQSAKSSLLCERAASAMSWQSCETVDRHFIGELGLSYFVEIISFKSQSKEALEMFPTCWKQCHTLI